jgi:hypothetical protein
MFCSDGKKPQHVESWVIGIIWREDKFHDDMRNRNVLPTSCGHLILHAPERRPFGSVGARLFDDEPSEHRR